MPESGTNLRMEFSKYNMIPGLYFVKIGEKNMVISKKFMIN